MISNLDKMQKVSIIVPVYNVEKYLPHCVEGILAQTYTDWELLLVDDGSPDDCGKLCDTYAAKDSRIRVFHKENGGVSSARNLGLDNAKGDWITFVDSDDWIAKDTFECCLNIISGENSLVNDVIRFEMESVGGEESVHSALKYMTKTEYVSRIVSRSTTLGVCGGLYRKDLFDKTNIRFDEALISGEDWLVLLSLVIHAKSIAFINKPLYFYFKDNSTSCTYKFRYEAAYSTLKAQKCISMLIKANYEDNYDVDLAKGKCKLIYNFIAHSIIQPIDISPHNFQKYINTANLQYQDIRIAQPTLFQKILLVLSMSKMIRIIIKLRLKKYERNSSRRRFWHKALPYHQGRK